jgi:hypothetical protein
VEKISSIVPGSRRVASADMAAASAVRPGTPSYGRPMGSSTGGLKSALTTAQRAIAEQQKMLDDRKLSAQNSAIVQDMADRFFLQKPILETAPAWTPPSGPAVMPRPPDAAEAQPAEPGAGESEEMEAGPGDEIPEAPMPVTAAGPDEYVPVGTYLNVSV